MEIYRVNPVLFRFIHIYATAAPIASYTNIPTGQPTTKYAELSWLEQLFHRKGLLVAVLMPPLPPPLAPANSIQADTQSGGEALFFCPRRSWYFSCSDKRCTLSQIAIVNKFFFLCLTVCRPYFPFAARALPSILCLIFAAFSLEPVARVSCCLALVVYDKQKDGSVQHKL